MNTEQIRLTEALADRYRIERELGQGGMATVYLADDFRHDRKVAVKVLLPELAAVIGADRFLAEIKTTANLQHPHILPLFDSGQADGFLYYVMPFIEGESLADRLAREKQLPVNEAVKIVADVASALDYAHRHGVIHRDIKPGNILLHDGRALVADFGIALAASKAGGSRMTETGMSLGTPHYMSPEQAMGEREITGRSDIYSLGAVLYELLVGEPPFTGPTAQAIIARVLTEPPRQILAQRHTVPPGVEAAVVRALEKLPADRFNTAAEFEQALTSGSPVSATAPLPAAAPARRMDRRLVAAIALAGVALGAGAGYTLHPSAPPPTLGRFALQIDPVRTLATGFAQQLALSPDGNTVAFVGRGPQGNQVYIRGLADTIPRPVAGTQGAHSAFFSADASQIGFWTPTQQLLRVPIEGGTATRIADSAGSFAAWNDDGSVVYTDPIGREMRLALPDGTSRLVTRSDSALFLAISSLPGSRAVLATQLTGGRSRMNVVAVSLADGTVSDAGLSDVLMARYVPEGKVVYQRRGGGPLLATTFNLKTLHAGGEGRAVASAARVTFRVVPQWDAAATSILVQPPSPMALVLTDRNGRVTPLEDEPRTYHHPRFSPDGRRIALDITDQDRDVWLVDPRDRRMWRLTIGETANDPYWSPDGRRIAYTAVRGGVRGVFLRNADGSGSPDSVYTDQNDHSSGSWSPDGKTLVVSTGAQSGLWVVPLEHPETAAPFQGTRFNDAYPALSRDGRWLAYVSDESGRQEVYVRPFPSSGGKIQVSVNGGSEPVFTADGRELIYREDNGTGSMLIAAAIRTAGGFEILSRTRLFDVTNYAVAEDHANYDVSPDGRTLVMIQNIQASQIHLVRNWEVQLK